MAPFLALITPLSGGQIDNTLPTPQPPVDPGYSPGWARPQPPRPDNTLPRPPGVPTHPIYNPAYPDNSLPGGQPYPDQGLPGGQPYPDQGLPGGQGGRPSQPIYFPPEGGQPPLGIWGPTDPRPGYGLPKPPNVPSHPIVLPPDLPPATEDGKPIDWHTAWTPSTGWIVVGVPSEETPHPTPSK